MGSVHAVSKDTNSCEELVDDNWFHDIQLELTTFGANGDGQVVTHRFESAHVHHFRNDGVNLPWHNGRASLHSWKIDLLDTTAWTRRQESEIIANLRNLDSHTAEHTREK